VLDLETVIPDDFDDTIGLFIQKLDRIETVTEEKRSLLNDIVEMAKKLPHMLFYGDCRNYGVQRVGQSRIFIVPDDQKGNLKPFRGKRIRIVCLSSGHYGGRDLLAFVPKKAD
jgi:hypothetical protein